MMGQGGVPVCDIKRRPVDLRACSPLHWVRGGGQRGTGHGGPKGRFRTRPHILFLSEGNSVGKGLTNNVKRQREQEASTRNSYSTLSKTKI